MRTGDNRTMDQELVEAIKTLHKGVDALNRTLSEDYPRRSEIKRARVNFAIATLLGLFISSLVTIGTVSGCFLSKSAVDGHPPAVCSILPGYATTQARAQRQKAHTEKLFRDIEKLKARLGEK